MGAFKAVVVEKGEGGSGQTVAVRQFDESELMEGDCSVSWKFLTTRYWLCARDSL